MKRVFLYLFILVFLLLVGWLVFYFYNKKNASPVTDIKTERPQKKLIENSVTITGIIQPLREIEIKPKITGVLETLYVNEGDYVTTSQLIGKVRLITNQVNLNSAEYELKQATASFQDAERQVKRHKPLFDEKIISQQEYDTYLLSYNLKKEQLAGLRDNLKILNTGARSASQGNNLIYANSNGVIVNLPLKTGSTVIEANTFNDGTTIATIADMNLLIFEGKIDEAEVGKIRAGLPLVIKIGALNDKSYNTTIDYIAPKGNMEDGIVKFRVRATLPPEISKGLRSGYSATGEAIIARKDSALSISEKLLQFDHEKPFVEVRQQDGSFRKQFITTGISDGITIEVGGLKETDEIKSPL